MRDYIITFKILTVIALFSLGYLMGAIFTDNTIEPINNQSAYIYSDISAQTGFLNSENIMARFECLEYPVAGEEELQQVYLIDVYRYPELDNPVSYRVDTFEEAILFLKGLR